MKRLTCLAFLLLLPREGLAEVNLAIGQQMFICGGNRSRTEATDGLLSTVFSASQYECSSSELFLELRLDVDSLVHFVRVYPVNMETFLEQDNRVDLASTKRGRFSQETCGDLRLGERNHTFAGVNCDYFRILFDIVRIVPYAENITVKEIEVWAIGDGRHGDTTVAHRGCFSRFGSAEELGDLPDVRYCFARCEMNGFVFAALKKNPKTKKGACICASDFDEEDEVLVTKCNEVCGSLNDRCGSEKYYSVYAVRIALPHYRGCYTPTQNPKRTLVDRLDLRSCLNHCHEERFIYIHPKNTCTCSNLPSERDYEADCHSECERNRNQYCGGATTAVSYTTCQFDSTDSMNCSQLFKCNGVYNAFGMCDHGCMKGFSGLHCIERNLFESSGREKDDLVVTESPMSDSKVTGQSVRIETSTESTVEEFQTPARRSPQRSNGKHMEAEIQDRSLDLFPFVWMFVITVMLGILIFAFRALTPKPRIEPITSPPDASPVTSNLKVGH